MQNVADSTTTAWLFGEGYRSVDKDQQSSSMTMGTVLIHCGVGTNAGVLGFV